MNNGIEADPDEPIKDVKEMTDQIELEPEEYFKDVKTKLQVADAEKFKEQLAVISSQIVASKDLGQKAFLHRLVFTHNTILKEQQLLAAGFDTYITRTDAMKFIQNVKPRNSVKIIELSRYPRALPEHAQISTKKALDLGIVDEFVVIFTDLTDNDYKTPEEKEFVQRNRDPIIFGMFKHDQTGLKHDRMYYIDSWQDDFCDLDFPTMVTKMAELGIKNPDKKISTDFEYLNTIVMDVTNEINTPPSKKYDELVKQQAVTPPPTAPSTFLDKVKSWFSSNEKH